MTEARPEDLRGGRGRRLGGRNRRPPAGEHRRADGGAGRGDDARRERVGGVGIHDRVRVAVAIVEHERLEVRRTPAELLERAHAQK
eukprot:scaffold133447_cov114-Phaeocystis_antarctica.AAC.2